MKRLPALLLALLLAGTTLLLCACGEDSDDTGSGSRKNSPPEALAKAYVEAQCAYDVQGMLDCFSDFSINYLMDWYDVGSKDKLIQRLEEDYDEVKKVSCTILKAEVVEENDTTYDLADFKKKLNRFYPTDEQLEKVTEFCEVRVTFEYDGSETRLTITCFKYNGRWYVYG